MISRVLLSSICCRTNAQLSLQDVALSNKRCPRRSARSGSSAATLTIHPNHIPYLQVLPLGMETVRVVDSSTQHILDPFIAVPATPPLPYLHQPRPDSRSRRSDRASVGQLLTRIRHQVITRQLLLEFSNCRPPSRDPE